MADFIKSLKDKLKDELFLILSKKENISKPLSLS